MRKEHSISGFNFLVEHDGGRRKSTYAFTEQGIYMATELRGQAVDDPFEKYSNARKNIDEIMGGKILEFKGERIYNEGKEEGKKEGKKEGKIEELLGMAYDHAISEDAAVERAWTKYNISKDKFMEMLLAYKPEDNLMQG